MSKPHISCLVQQLLGATDGRADVAATAMGVSSSTVVRWRRGEAHPPGAQVRKVEKLLSQSHLQSQLRIFDDPVSRQRGMEDALAATLHALREEFHRAGHVSSRQDVLDVVAALVFAHVTDIDTGGTGIGIDLLKTEISAASALNSYVWRAFQRHIPDRLQKEIDLSKFYYDIPPENEGLAANLIAIFNSEGSLFRERHQNGGDDLINHVFGRFMSTSFVDEKEMGQYLTPPEVVRFMVALGLAALPSHVCERLTDPNVEQRDGIILDPSCGVGSFLAETAGALYEQVKEKRTSHESGIWLRRFMQQNVVGIDRSARMIRLGMINLAMFGTPNVRMTVANALARRGLDGETTESLERKAQLILTNPPFGASFSGPDLDGFAVAKGSTRLDSEVLFVERYLDWLAPGGVAVSIVPDSILTNKGAFARLRALLVGKADVEAVISLPSVAFAAAGTSTKTSVLVLRRHALAQSNSRGTFFAIADHVGFEVVTRSGQRRRTRTAANDLDQIAADFVQAQRHVSGKPGIGTSDLRWDAGYHAELPKASRQLAEAEGATVPVSELADLVTDRVAPGRNSNDEFCYIEISDVDPRTGLIDYKLMSATEAPSRARKRVRAGDVLVSTVRPERGAIGVVPEHLDGAICSTGFAVLRPHLIASHALAWLLKTDFVRHQMGRHNVGIAYPVIDEAICLQLAVPKQVLEAVSLQALALQNAEASFRAALSGMEAAVRGESPILPIG